VKQVKSGGEESTLQGHTLRVLQKQSDGTWQTKVHVFVPLPPTTPQEAKKSPWRSARLHTTGRALIVAGIDADCGDITPLV
jgi:hypothetical protein